MRRLLAISVAVSLAAAATALGSTPLDGTFAAQRDKVEKGYELSFKVSGGGHRLFNVSARLLETCNGLGTSRMTTVRPLSTWTVKNGKFAASKKEKRAGAAITTTLEGQFTTMHKAVGSIRQVKVTAGRTCDTYKVPFTAKRG